MCRILCTLRISKFTSPAAAQLEPKEQLKLIRPSLYYSQLRSQNLYRCCVYMNFGKTNCSLADVADTAMDRLCKQSSCISVGFSGS